MPKYEVQRTIIETRVIEADAAEEAESLMSQYGPDDVDATATDVIAEQVDDDTPLPDEPNTDRKVIVAGSPLDGLTIIGPFVTADDAIEYAQNHRGLRDDSWWVASLDQPE